MTDLIDPMRGSGVPLAPALTARPEVAAGLSGPGAPPEPSDGFTRSASLAAATRVSGQLPGAAATRPLTEEEKQDFSSWFPKLDVNAARVSGEATPRYNCISWTTGNTRSWDWPPSMYPDSEPRAAFDQYYRERGFTPEQPGQRADGLEHVAYWEDPNGPTHGSVAGPVHGERWESKCGQAAKIQHGKDELESDVYGKIAGYWVKTGEGKDVPVDALSPDLEKRLDGKLATRVAALDPQLVESFEKAYASWQKERSSPRLQLASDPHKLLTGSGYEQLKQLGAEALPLWVQKMRQGDFFCQYAVGELTRQERGPGEFQIKDGLRQPPLQPTEVRCSEQAKAHQLLGQWLQSDW